jgi:hypothetical protein
VLLDAGEINVFEFDSLVHQYKKAAQQLWGFCNGRWGRFGVTARIIEDDERERGTPPTGGSSPPHAGADNRGPVWYPEFVTRGGKSPMPQEPAQRKSPPERDLSSKRLKRLELSTFCMASRSSDLASLTKCL